MHPKIPFMLIALVSIAAGQPTVLNSIYSASQYQNLVKSVPNGKLYKISAPEHTELKVMHLFGSPRERGVAHGQLLSAELIDFVENDLPAFFRSAPDTIALSSENAPARPSRMRAAVSRVATRQLHMRVGAYRCNRCPQPTWAPPRPTHIHGIDHVLNEPDVPSTLMPSSMLGSQLVVRW